MVNTQHLVASYLAARRQHREAARLMAAAEAALDRMLQHGVHENRAWLLAGMDLADRRCIRAYHEMLRARRLLA